MSFVHLPWWQILIVTVLSGGITYLAMVLSLWLCSRVLVEPGDSKQKDGSDFVPLLAFPLASAVICCIVAYRSGSLLPIVFALILLAVLSACWVSDVRRGVIFDIFTLPLLGLSVLIGVLTHDYFPLISSFVVAAPFALTAFTSKGKGMGWGDVKLVAAASSIVGLQASIFVLVLACLVVSVVGFLTKRSKDSPMGFAPYLASLFAIALVFPQPGAY